jgi:hypothetical protein
MSEEHDRKTISDLDSAASIESTDLFIVSKLSDGDYVSKKISFSDLATEVAQHNHDGDYAPIGSGGSGGGGGPGEIHAFHTPNGLVDPDGKIDANDFEEAIDTTSSSSSKIDQAGNSSFRMFKIPDTGTFILEVDASLQDRDSGSSDSFQLTLHSCDSETGVTETSDGSVVMTELANGALTGGSSTAGAYASSRVKYKKVMPNGTFFYLKVTRNGGGVTSRLTASVKVTRDDGSGSSGGGPVFLSSKVALFTSLTSLSLTSYDLNGLASVPTTASSAILECFWSLNSPDSTSPSTLLVGSTESPTPPYVLAHMQAAGSGDEVAGANQGVCPLASGTIWAQMTGPTINGNGTPGFTCYVVGYYP